MVQGRQAEAEGYDRAMPNIRLIEPDDADGVLKEEYDAALGRAGKIFNIVKAMSLRPEVLRQSMEMYKAIMFGPSRLTRAERELLATVTSQINECHY
jgi:alkylhydroperoxidase family enzyme